MDEEATTSTMKEKIDERRKALACFGDHSWSVEFHNAVLEVFPRVHFDHNSLLLRCGGSFSFHSVGPRPVRFEASLMLHAAYEDVVRLAWSDHGSFSRKLLSFKDGSLSFNLMFLVILSGNVVLRLR